MIYIECKSCNQPMYYLKEMPIEGQVIQEAFNQDGSLLYKTGDMFRCKNCNVWWNHPETYQFKEEGSGEKKETKVQGTVP